ncbi:cysteine--tRNA ligase [Lacticigenium naphthae]|uniref:cysteine--tRNA ligase n=1 Tax=Lacticigenium naphthae TaxID=515351 RepID=UPI000424F7F5|nr:cysteine--tRNA ligase [Lacticigenium naphthae]
MIKLYNTLTRQKETFEPLEPGKVKMYVCGPTVYNYIHIGNARSIVAFDTIRRYFEYRGYEVDYVSNFTDVDDKIIKAAKELEISAPELANRFIAAYKEDTQKLCVKEPTASPRVMENIPDIIAFIQALIDKGYAYVSQGDVYYRTRKFEGYGKLSGISIDELAEGASQRVVENTRKEDAVDFTLWKAAKEDEISWDAPWGKGRPGWHIECSVMVKKYLGETIDIHAGGQDLTFPHHENEIAQSEAKHGQTFARYWLHNGFVTMDQEKMSKSLGNVVFVHDLVEEVDPQIIRFFMATAHYRHPIHYSKETLTEAETNLKRLQTAYQNAHHRLATAVERTTEDAKMLEKVESVEKAFVEKMDDDFNTANGISVLYDFAKQINIYSEGATVSKTVIEAMLNTMQRLLAIYGIELKTETELLDDEINQLIQERQQARKERDFQRADDIRDQLKAQGILLEDTPQGIRWRRGNENG